MVHPTMKTSPRVLYTAGKEDGLHFPHGNSPIRGVPEQIHWYNLHRLQSEKLVALFAMELSRR